MRHFLALALLGTLACQARADDATPDDRWTGTGELGLASAKGNTDSQTYVGKLKLAKDTGQWAYGFGGQFLYAKSDGEESARRHEAYGSAAYELNERSYLNSTVRTLRDHYATYEYQHSAAIGYGYKAIENQRTKLLFEIGPGYRWSKLQDEQVHDNGVIVRGYSDFSHKLTDTTSLFNTLLVESGNGNTYASDDIGLQVQMSKALALKAGYQVHHNSKALEGTRKTDTLTTVNVVYGF